MTARPEPTAEPIDALPVLSLPLKTSRRSVREFLPEVEDARSAGVAHRPTRGSGAGRVRLSHGRTLPPLRGGESRVHHEVRCYRRRVLHHQCVLRHDTLSRHPPPPGRLPLAAGPSAAEALVQFAAAYAKKTGRTLQVSALRMSTERGRTLEPTAVLPCGIPSGSDLFVGGAQPVLAPGATDAPVYAKEGSKVAASQGKMGENSYYYRLG